MIPFFLFLTACIVTLLHLFIKKYRTPPEIIKTFLSYLVLFNIGMMGLLAFYAHTFLADNTAEKIGWATGSPFQFEVAVANLSYGLLGIIAYVSKPPFIKATIIGYTVFVVGAFVGHLIQYQKGDIAPYNIGLFVWFNDLLIPLLLLSLLTLKEKYAAK